MNASAAGENFRRLRESLPEHVTLVVAAKGRSVNEVAAVIEAGARVIGENYVPEVERHRDGLGALADRAEWHMIGHVQRNKTRRALARCDVIQSVDSARLARALNERAEGPVRVCVEVCIAGEQSKQGVAP